MSPYSSLQGIIFDHHTGAIINATAANSPPKNKTNKHLQHLPTHQFTHSPNKMSAERPINIEQIRAEARGLKYRPAKRKAPEQPSSDPHALFTVCTGARWMELGQREPAAKMLFGQLWHQHELCILFAGTNIGKSVLAVQIGDSIARSRGTGPFACGAESERVLYVDFELSTKQFYHRYSHQQNDYEFPSNFFRAQFNPVDVVTGNFDSYDDLLIAGIEQKVELVKATVLIIDNISCLRTGTESAAVALRLMNNLKALKADYHLSILVLAHTPKRRSPTRPISDNDLHGSKLLINLADSAFAIGRSHNDKSLCYLKQIKQRNTRQLYGEDNVCLCRIIRPGNFLQFRFEGYSTERLHLPAEGKPGNNRSITDHEQIAKQAKELSAQGHSQRSISRGLNISLGLVNKLLNLRENSPNNTPKITKNQ